jgi:5-formyltetrahydrofolate cyclo-ligase
LLAVPRNLRGVRRIAEPCARQKYGHRLGYGKGYYDRTLRTLRAVGGARRAFGLAFALQEVPEVPAAPFDEPLDAIVTERGLVRIARP